MTSHASRQLHCIALHCIVLHCIVLYCIVLYCISKLGNRLKKILPLITYLLVKRKLIFLQVNDLYTRNLFLGRCDDVMERVMAKLGLVIPEYKRLVELSMFWLMLSRILFLT